MNGLMPIKWKDFFFTQCKLFSLLENLVLSLEFMSNQNTMLMIWFASVKIENNERTPIVKYYNK